MFKYDLHVHTAEVSLCGEVGAKEVVTMYKKNGYEGIVITDHFHYRYFKTLSVSSWEEKIDLFFSGYRKAYQAGKQLGFKVLPAIEICFLDSPNDYLVFGLNKEFLKKHKELYRVKLKSFKKMIADTDCLIYQAHPFRDNMVIVNPSLVDGIEVYNGNKRHNSRNKLAYLFAQENNLKMISGSDFHKKEDISRGGIILPHRVNSITGLVHFLRNNNNIKLLKPGKMQTV